jgi:hypothetical protein
MEPSREKWHDGIGYDLDLLRNATPAEVAAIESLLLSKSISDWRDVEALAALGTGRALVALRQTWDGGDDRVRLDIARFAPDLIEPSARGSQLALALATAEMGSGLSEAIDEAAEFHPPEIVAALWSGLLEREGLAAYHFAALLFVIHGKCDSIYDFEHRDLFLRFNTEDRAEREAACADLQAQLSAQSLLADPSAAPVS